MPQAILTKYLPATNTRGRRIKATCERGSITVPYPEGSGDVPHITAARLLREKFIKEDAEKYGSNHNPWAAPFVCGGIPGACVHVSTDFNNNVVIGCANLEDAQRLVATVKRCNPDGQISQLDKGLLGSIFKRAKV